MEMINIWTELLQMEGWVRVEISCENLSWHRLHVAGQLFRRSGRRLYTWSRRCAKYKCLGPGRPVGERPGFKHNQHIQSGSDRQWGHDPA